MLIVLALLYSCNNQTKNNLTLKTVLNSGQKEQQDPKVEQQAPKVEQQAPENLDWERGIWESEEWNNKIYGMEFRVNLFALNYIDSELTLFGSTRMNGSTTDIVEIYNPENKASSNKDPEDYSYSFHYTTWSSDKEILFEADVNISYTIENSQFEIESNTIKDVNFSEYFLFSDTKKTIPLSAEWKNGKIETYTIAPIIVDPFSAEAKKEVQTFLGTNQITYEGYTLNIFEDKWYLYKGTYKSGNFPDLIMDSGIIIDNIFYDLSGSIEMGKKLHPSLIQFLLQDGLTIFSHLSDFED